MVQVKNDLTGQTFGQWTVICQVEDFVGKDGRHYAQWLCECSCEKKTRKNVVGKYLTSGDSTSCGCSRRHMYNKNGKPTNTYDLSKEYGIGFTSKGDKFWFDLEDYEIIKNYCWHYNSEGYLIATDGNTGKTISLHRLVMRVSDKHLDVDHKAHPPRNEHKVDNRKENLRIVEHCQNTQNRSLSSNNTSGTTGVYKHKKRDKWVARIRVRGRSIELGEFVLKEDAIKARKLAEIKYFQEYRYDKNN